MSYRRSRKVLPRIKNLLLRRGRWTPRHSMQAWILRTRREPASPRRSLNKSVLKRKRKRKSSATGSSKRWLENLNLKFITKILVTWVTNLSRVRNPLMCRLSRRRPTMVNKWKWWQAICNKVSNKSYRTSSSLRNIHQRRPLRFLSLSRTSLRSVLALSTSLVSLSSRVCSKGRLKKQTTSAAHSATET